MDSPLKYIGSKNNCADKIIGMMAKHSCYCEVFFGSGAIFFHKQPSKVEVINDKNGELVNFYKVIQRECDKFKERGKHELYSRELYHEYLSDFNSGKHFSMNNVERAFRFFCMLNESFSGTFGAGWSYSSTTNPAKQFSNKVLAIDEFSKRLSGVQIDNRDFEDVIKGYDSAETLYFVDPPYVKADVDTYYFKSLDSSFTLYDQQRLFTALKGIKGRCILTIDDVSWVRERYTIENGFYTIENKLFYSSANKEDKRYETELLIFNYNIEKEKKHVDMNQGTFNF